jgi:hypothetical protein
VHVASIRLEIDDRISNELSRSVVGDAPAASRFVNLDAAGCQRAGVRQDVRAAAIAFDAERQDVRVFDEKEHVARSPGAAILDERALKLERLAVPYAPETADLER